MPAYKDNNTGKWYISCWYGDWTGKRKKKIKRGFETKREALEWEREFQLQDSSNPEMTFESFIGLYKQDVLPKLKENSWLTKENIIRNISGNSEFAILLLRMSLTGRMKCGKP